LRDIIEPIDGLQFLSQTEKHELSHLYEAKIMNMILHGIEALNIIHTNTLTESLADV
jgi:type I restriction enzyme M protein